MDLTEQRLNQHQIAAKDVSPEAKLQATPPGVAVDLTEQRLNQHQIAAKDVSPEAKLQATLPGVAVDRTGLEPVTSRV